MKKQSILLAILLLSFCFFIFSSCSSDDKETEQSQEETLQSETLVVASKLIKTESEGWWFWVKKKGNVSWEIMYDGISKFNFEEGYEYVIEVEVKKIKNPAADQSEYQYTLLKTISKEKKDSDVPFLTSDFSLCNQEDEVAFPNKKKVKITLSNGIETERVDTFHILQGDILLTKTQLNELTNNNVYTRSGHITSTIKYWTNHIVYYTFAKEFTLQANVKAAIKEWENKTSLKFVEGTGRGNYIEFFHGDGNYSYIGMIGGKQNLSLSINGSSAGTAIHEIGHAVGLIHEQCRNDRDNYINIYWGNISNGKSHNFDLYPTGEVKDIGSFDFNSIMLYSSNAFAISGTYTMTTKNGLYFVGQRVRLSEGDVEGVKSMYGPPYHRLSKTISVIREEIYGLEDIFEYECTNIIYFYVDASCTSRTTLPFPRNITVIIDTKRCDGYGQKVNENRSYQYITIPAGASSYNLGTTHNMEWYTMSNPQQIDVTSYTVLE